MKHVPFEIAKLLKEKGFDEHTICGYNGAYEPYHLSLIEFADSQRNSELINLVYSAPTISDVVDWVYEKHGIWISVAPRFYNDGSLWFVYESLDISKNDIESLNNNLFQGIFEMYKSPSEAYLVGIEYTLNNLI